MDKEKINKLFKDFSSNEFENKLKLDLLDNLTKYLELNELLKQKLPYVRKLDIKQEIKYLKSKIKIKLNLINKISKNKIV